MRKHHESCIGLALAGHADRAAGNAKRAEKYDNPLTDFINLMIAEAKAKQKKQKKGILDISAPYNVPYSGEKAC